jgi:hypothetical protein
MILCKTPKAAKYTKLRMNTIRRRKKEGGDGSVVVDRIPSSSTTFPFLFLQP